VPRKLESLKSNPDFATGQIEAISARVNQIADGELSRAKSSNTIEFDSLISQMYQNRAAIEKLIKTMEGK